MLTQWGGNAYPAYKETLFESSTGKPLLISNNTSYSLLSILISAWLCAKHSNQPIEEGTQCNYPQVPEEKTETLG